MTTHFFPKIKSCFSYSTISTGRTAHLVIFSNQVKFPPRCPTVSPHRHITIPPARWTLWFFCRGFPVVKPQHPGASVRNHPVRVVEPALRVVVRQSQHLHVAQVVPLDVDADAVLGEIPVGQMVGIWTLTWLKMVEMVYGHPSHNRNPEKRWVSKSVSMVVGKISLGRFGIPSIIIYLLWKGNQPPLLINQPIGKGHLWCNKQIYMNLWDG